MKYTLKHRLVGAAVLAAIAVLFLPSFFKDKQAYSVNTKSQLPARPHIATEEFSAPQPVPNIEPAPAPENMFVPPTETTAEQPASIAASSVSSVSKSSAASSQQLSSVAVMPLNSQGLPDAWVVQVGSFTSKDAANKLRDELQADGQKAYVRTVTTGSASISRVYIGPKLDKAQAQAIKVQMDKRLKVNAMVVRFQP